MSIKEEKNGRVETAVVIQAPAVEEHEDAEGKNESEDRGQSPRRRSSIWHTVKNKLRITPKDATPVNWKMVILVFISLVRCRDVFSPSTETYQMINLL